MFNQVGEYLQRKSETEINQDWILFLAWLQIEILAKKKKKKKKIYIYIYIYLSTEIQVLWLVYVSEYIYIFLTSSCQSHGYEVHVFEKKNCILFKIHETYCQETSMRWWETIYFRFYPALLTIIKALFWI